MDLEHGKGPCPYSCALRSSPPSARNAIIEECAKLVESAECLPGCDSFAHDDLCPVVNTEAAIRAIKSASTDGKAADSDAGCEGSEATYTVEGYNDALNQLSGPGIRKT